MPPTPEPRADHVSIVRKPQGSEDSALRYSFPRYWPFARPDFFSI
jgi:hypothetical protein